MLLKTGRALTYGVVLGMFGVVLGLLGCVPVKPAASSREVMGRERSRVMLMRPIQAAAVDVARLFAQRGFALADAGHDDRGITLRFKGERKIVTEPVVDALDALVAVTDALEAYQRARQGRPQHHHYRYDHVADVAIGSVFYVRVEPRGATATSIVAIGRPTKNGQEACTPDPEIPWPCNRIVAGDTLYPEVAGVVEAEVIEGVFSELWLSGDVVSPDPAVLRAQHAAHLANQRCLERKRDLEALAGRVSDPRARAAILGAAPTCAADGERVGAATPAK